MLKKHGRVPRSCPKTGSLYQRCPTASHAFRADSLAKFKFTRLSPPPKTPPTSNQLERLGGRGDKVNAVESAPTNATEEPPHSSLLLSLQAENLPSNFSTSREQKRKERKRKVVEGEARGSFVSSLPCFHTAVPTLSRSGGN